MFIKDKIKTLAVSILLINLIGGGYLYVRNLGKKADIPVDPAVVASLKIFPSKISVTKDEDKEAQKAMLIVKVTNNTSKTLSDVYLIIPAGIDIGTIESSTTARITDLPQQSNDAVFSLGNITSHKTIERSIWVYSTQKKIYNIKVDIETKERYRTNTNSVVLTAE